MKTRLLLILFVASLLFAPMSFADNSKDDNQAWLFLPNSEWHLNIQLPDFENKALSINKEQTRLSFLSENDDSGLIISVFLDPAENEDGAEGCREYYKEKRSQDDLLEESVMRDWKYKNMLVNEYMIKSVAGEKVNSKHLHACLEKDDIWMDIHISKTPYTGRDRKLFFNVLKTVKIVEGLPEGFEEKAESIVEKYESIPDADKDAYGNYLLGTYYYADKEDYSKAKKYYRKAFNLNKKTWELGLEDWHNMINSFGISYALTDELERAEGIFKYGLKYSKKSVLFSYNLACVYADMGNEKRALYYLSRAYSYRNQDPIGWELTSPREDSTFEDLYDNFRFNTISDKIEKWIDEK